MAQAQREALQPEVKANTQDLASHMELNGARIAAERLINEFSYGLLSKPIL